MPSVKRKQQIREKEYKLASSKCRKIDKHFKVQNKAQKSDDAQHKNVNEIPNRISEINDSEGGQDARNNMCEVHLDDSSNKVFECKTQDAEARNNICEDHLDDSSNKAFECKTQDAEARNNICEVHLDDSSDKVFECKSQDTCCNSLELKVNDEEVSKQKRLVSSEEKNNQFKILNDGGKELDNIQKYDGQEESNKVCKVHLVESTNEDANISSKETNCDSDDFEDKNSQIEMLNKGKELNNMLNKGKELNNMQNKGKENEIQVTAGGCESQCINKQLSTKNSKHNTKFQSEWSLKYPWLKCDVIESKEYLFCLLCSKHLSSVPLHTNSPWIKDGFATVRLDKVKLHVESEMHKKAVQAETIEINMRSRAEENMKEDSETFQAVEAAMKCLHFLIQHDIPHTTVFKPFIDFCINELQSPVLAPLKKAKNASYTSHRVQSEFIEAMATIQNNAILSDINRSPSYSLLIDETSDINNRKHLAIVARYVKDGEISTSFIKDAEILDGKADTIFPALETEISKCGGIEKMNGFGSDGARVMIGNKDGVAAKLKRKNGKIISIHCHNHRLALATKDAFESIQCFAKMDEILTGLYKYYKNSSVRCASLREIQNIFSEGKGTTIKKAAHTRWLSHENVLNSIRLNFKSVILDLENAVVTKQSRIIPGVSGPTAEGLLKMMKTYEFFVLIHFLCDVLSITSKLNLIFEKRDVYLATVESQVAATISALEKLKRKPGGAYCKNVDKQAMQNGIIVSAADKDNFETNAKLFIDTLIENITKRLDNLPVITLLSVLNLSDFPHGCTFHGTSEISELAEFYDIDIDDLLSEWDQFKLLFLPENKIDEEQKELTIPYLLKTLSNLEQSVGNNLPHIKKLLSIASTLPVSTAEVERIFSQVKLIVTSHRNRLKIENVDNLINIKCNGPLPFHEAVKFWLSQKQRRIFF